MCFTPSFEAIQVVPQKKLIQHKAKMGNPMVLIRDKKAFFYFSFHGVDFNFWTQKNFLKSKYFRIKF